MEEAASYKEDPALTHSGHNKTVQCLFVCFDKRQDAKATISVSQSTEPIELASSGTQTRAFIEGPSMDNELDATQTNRRSRSLLIFQIIAGLLLLWAVVAYLVAPFVWRVYARHDSKFDESPRITETSDHHPGDPLNVAFVGTELQLQNLMKSAQWYPAAPLGLESDLKIAADSVFSRPDDDAPVSSLYLFGRKEDLAFEQPVGDNPRHRHHVRLWKTAQVSDDGRPQWIGSAVYDKRVGLSHTTGQITHVTAPDVDAERDFLFESLEKTGGLARHYVVPDFHKQLEGRNGGGDPWRTDGALYVGVIQLTP